MFILLSLALMIISFIVLYQSIDYPCIQNYVMGSLIGIISSLILLIKSINDAVSDSLSDKNRDKILDSFLYPAVNYENINTIKAYDWDDYKSNDISKKVIKKYRNSIKISVLEDNKLTNKMQNNLNQFFTESTIVPHNNDEANKESMNNSFHENSWHECYYG